MTGQVPWDRMKPSASPEPPSPAGGPLFPVTPAGGRAMISDEGAHFLLHLPLPPVSPENVHVEVGERQVIIRGQHKESTELKGDGYFRAERQMGAFHYSIALPGPVLPSAAQAGFEDGVLTVSLPKRP